MSVRNDGPPCKGGNRLRAGVLGLAVLVTGCVDPAAVRHASPPADPFLGALRGGYLELADSRAAGGQPFIASFYAHKARAAGRGKPVRPERLEDWSVDPDEREPLLVARARLSTSLAESQFRVGTAHAAEAQVMFDCWLELQESRQEPTQCRDRFWRSLALFEDNLARHRAGDRAGRPLSLQRPMNHEPRSPS